jgi:hypothetical protein
MVGAKPDGQRQHRDVDGARMAYVSGILHPGGQSRRDPYCRGITRHRNVKHHLSHSRCSGARTCDPMDLRTVGSCDAGQC